MNSFYEELYYLILGSQTVKITNIGKYPYIGAIPKRENIHSICNRKQPWNNINGFNAPTLIVRALDGFASLIGKPGPIKILKMLPEMTYEFNFGGGE